MNLSNIAKHFSDPEAFIELNSKHKAGKYWKRVKWLLIFLVATAIISFYYATWIQAQSITRQQRLDQYLKQAQIANGIQQRHYKIIYSND